MVRSPCGGWINNIQRGVPARTWWLYDRLCSACLQSAASQYRNPRTVTALPGGFTHQIFLPVFSILINGVFAMSKEMTVVSSRKAGLRIWQT